MQLNIYSSCLNLPSFHPDSLISLTYVKISKIDVTLRNIAGFEVLYADAPSLNSSYNPHPITGFHSIIEHLRHNETDIDNYLADSKKADFYIFNNLITHVLLPAIKHNLWLDSSNFVEVSRPAFSTLSFFPISIYFPINHRNKIQSYFKHNLKYKTLDENFLSKKVLHEGKEAINLLSSKLAHQKYFFGEKPSSLDALLFGTLAPLLFTTLPSKVLQVHLKASPNLVAYCQRMLEEYFPEHATMIQEAKKREEEILKEKARKSLELGDFPNRKRDLMIGLGLAGASILLYSIISGKLVKVIVLKDIDA